MPCVFCGTTPLTKEHVFPSWLNRYLPSDRIQQLEQSRYGAGAFDVTRRSAGMDFTVRKICAECNNGWMSDLEATSIAPLDPLIGSLELQMMSLADQRRIALWAAKTAMMLDLTQSEPILAPDKFRRMRSNRTIPGGTRVWLGACGEIYPLVTAHITRANVMKMDEPEKELPIGLYTPMKIGHVCLYVYFADSRFVIRYPPEYYLALARIWPRRASDLPLVATTIDW